MVKGASLCDGVNGINPARLTPGSAGRLRTDVQHYPLPVSSIPGSLKKNSAYSCPS